MVWSRGGEGGRVLAVGKMLVRRDGKGEKYKIICPVDFLYS